MNNDQLPAVLPTKGKPLKGAEARQVATWLERYARRKPACPLAPRATRFLRLARRGRAPLSAGRFHAILAYVQRYKAQHEPRRLQLTLTGSSIGFNWGDSQSPMGRGSVGPGNPPPSIPQRNFRV